MKYKFIKYLSLGLLGIVSTYVIWGVAIEPYWIDREEEIAEIPGLPSAWQGKKVGVIADMQVGMWWDNTPTIRRIVEQLVAEPPAIVLIAGDFIYHPGKDPTTEIKKVTALIRPLVEAGIPTYAVLGNHDYGINKQQAPRDERLSVQVQDALKAAGVRVLKNEAVPLNLTQTQSRTDEAALYLVGIGPRLPKEDKPKVALAQVPDNAPRLVMMHNPKTFEALPANAAPLAVAGHTHGGQIRLLPFGVTPLWFLVSDEEDLVPAAGWVEGYGQPGNRLYINRGIGFSRVPVRINAPPELTLFTLRQGSDAATE